MLESQYDFVMEITGEEGQVIHRGEIFNNLSPCYEELLFMGVCEGTFSNDGALPSAFVEPVWSPSGPPDATGFSISLPPFSPQKHNWSILKDHLRHILCEKDLVEQTDDENPDSSKARMVKVQWAVRAYERSTQEEKPSRLSCTLVRQPLPFTHRAFTSFGIDNVPPEQSPVVIVMARPLLAQLREEAADSLEKERANILTGHLVKDPAMGQAVVVLGKIPAETDTAGSRAHFAFSPLTFLSIQQDLALRANGEIIVGWWHNHPPPCGGECRLIIPPCKTSTVFFSSADRAVQRSSFPDPYMVAFVSGKGERKGPHDPETRSFGWKNGQIAEREFHVF